MLPVKLRRPDPAAHVQLPIRRFRFRQWRGKGGKEEQRNRRTTYVSEDDEEGSAPQVRRV